MTPEQIEKAQGDRFPRFFAEYKAFLFDIKGISEEEFRQDWFDYMQTCLDNTPKKHIRSWQRLTKEKRVNYVLVSAKIRSHDPKKIKAFIYEQKTLYQRGILLREIIHKGGSSEEDVSFYSQNLVEFCEAGFWSGLFNPEATEPTTLRPFQSVEVLQKDLQALTSTGSWEPLGDVETPIILVQDLPLKAAQEGCVDFWLRTEAQGGFDSTPLIHICPKQWGPLIRRGLDFHLDHPNQTQLTKYTGLWKKTPPPYSKCAMVVTPFLEIPPASPLHKSLHENLQKSAQGKLCTVAFTGFVLVDGVYSTGWLMNLEDGTSQWGLHKIHDNGHWLESYFSTVLIMLLHEIKERSSCTITSPSTRELRRTLKSLPSKESRQAKSPSVYYVSPITSKLRTVPDFEDLCVPRKARKLLAFRYHVRSHDRLYVRRGELPISPEDKVKLQGRGYVVSEEPSETFELEYAFRRKHIPTQKQHEWIACRIVDIEEHVRGPEDGPLIPPLKTLPPE